MVYAALVFGVFLNRVVYTYLRNAFLYINYYFLAVFDKNIYPGVVMWQPLEPVNGICNVCFDADDAGPADSVCWTPAGSAWLGFSSCTLGWTFVLYG